MKDIRSRRKFLRAAAAAGAVGLAGCGGADTGDGGGGDDGGDDTGGDDTASDGGAASPTDTRTPDATLTPTATPSATPSADESGADDGIDDGGTTDGGADDGGEDGGEATPTPTPTPSGPEEVADLSGSDEALAKFGNAVAVDGDRALVAAHEADARVEDAGRVYVFERSGGWSREATLVAPNPAKYDGFGVSVALDGDRALIGARGYDDGETVNRGAAFVFERRDGGWAHTADLFAGDGDAGDEFGVVALSGDTAVVGAPKERLSTDEEDETGTLTRTETASGDDESRAVGAAYVFRLSGGEWAQETKLTAADGDRNDRFGSAVAFDGSTALVGAVGEETGGTGGGAGAAYAFERREDGWRQVAKLVADDAAAEDRFGGTVAVDGNTVLVGARAADTAAGKGAGKAYVFRRIASRDGTEDWVQSAELAAADGDKDDRFGKAVALAGDHAVVGAFGDDTGAGELGGAAYLFEDADEWTRRAKFTTRDRGQYELLGSAVALSGAFAVAGAPGVDTRDDDVGAAYVYSV